MAGTRFLTVTVRSERLQVNKGEKNDAYGGGLQSETSIWTNV